MNDHLAPAGISESVLWIEKVANLFKPFKPEIKKVVINYKTKRVETSLMVVVPDGARRKLAKIEIPAYEGLKFEKMWDDMFNELQVPVTFQEEKWILNPSSLPNREKFLIQMSGSFPETTLNKLIRIQPSINKDTTSELDRYWLDSMIRDPEIIESFWRALDVDEVNVGVKIGIQHLFSASIPNHMNRMLWARQKWQAAGVGRNPNEVFNAWRNLRLASRDSNIPADEVLVMVNILTSGELFSKYVRVDPPYELGEIRRESIMMDIFPEKMNVETKTVLNLKNPAATGYLSFLKLKYEERVKEYLTKMDGK